MNTQIEPTRSPILVIAFAIVAAFAAAANAQTPSPSPPPADAEAATAAATPAAVPASAPPHATGAVFTNYKGVSIGMTSSESRKKLGSPEDKGDEQDFYIFSSHETAQIFYDAEHKVKAMAITYTGDLDSALTPVQVFGEDIAPNAEGAIYHMVRYPDAGYWVSYSRTAGEDPIVSIAIQKM